jgi:hypothetical protein
MRARHLGTAFLLLGLLVGMAAGVGLLVGFEPSRLPAALLDIAAYKLTFLAALALMATGAVLARHARTVEARLDARRRADERLRELSPAAPDPTAGPRSTPVVPAERPRR